MDDWRIARRAQTNLLVIGLNGPLQSVVETLGPELAEPIATWCQGERLVLPPSDRRGTIILHGVGALPPDDQVQLLEWLEQTEGQTQVVSTSLEPLLPRVEAGAFSDTLYYRLNTVCVDVTTNLSVQ